MIEKSRYTHRITLLLIILVALLLRLVAISARPICYDEAFAILFAEQGKRALVAGTLTPVGGVASDVHPLAYYMLLFWWMRLFGESLIYVRLLSILFGVGTIAIVYLFARPECYADPLPPLPHRRAVPLQSDTDEILSPARPVLREEDVRATVVHAAVRFIHEAPLDEVRLLAELISRIESGRRAYGAWSAAGEQRDLAREEH